MRLQLILCLGLCVLYSPIRGQSVNSSSTEVKPGTDGYQYHNTAISANFLFGYYQQDGNHSAVTGGTGTEELTDRDFRFIINIPLDSVQALNINAGVNYYSSASTDNIDSKVSSASSHDVRSQFYFNYSRVLVNSGSTITLGWGGSVESDYISTSVNASWNKSMSNGNRQLDIGGQVFFDNWVLIIPEELRVPGTELPNTDRRRSYSLIASWQQVINPRLQASISAELVYQHGLLSTPFHRVYFMGQDTAKIEKLPANRIKIPVSIRLNYFLADLAVFRSFFRYYHDDFGIDAFTGSLEPRLKLNPFFSTYPFYRFHYQTPADHFAPYKQHSISEDYYSSDYDLSGFESHSFGVGLYWSPLYGIGRFRFFSKTRPTLFRSVDLRYTHYLRSDGLKANMIGVDFGFSRIK